jgi:hypothetical protein
MVRAAALILSIALATSASAAQYHFMDSLPAGALLIDSETITHVDANPTVWVSMFLARDGDGISAGLGTAYIMTKDEVDCPHSRVRHLAFHGFTSRGTPTEGEALVSPWDDAVPGTNQALEVRFVCDAEFTRHDYAFTMESLDMLKTVRKMYADGSFPRKQ